MYLAIVQGLTLLQRIDGQCPAVSVGRSHDGRLQVEAQIVPQQVGRVEFTILCAAQELLEPARLGRVEEAEDAALVLAKSAAVRLGPSRQATIGCRGQQSSNSCGRSSEAARFVISAMFSDSGLGTAGS